MANCEHDFKPVCIMETPSCGKCGVMKSIVDAMTWAPTPMLGWGLLPVDVLEEVIAVLEHGAVKYTPDGWKDIKPRPVMQSRLGMPEPFLTQLTPSHYYRNKAMGHYQEASYLHAMGQPHQNEEESGLPHLAHAIVNLIFALWHDKNTPKENKND